MKFLISCIAGILLWIFMYIPVVYYNEKINHKIIDYELRLELKDTVIMFAIVYIVWVFFIVYTY